jgi:hypothetical protein
MKGAGLSVSISKWSSVWIKIGGIPKEQFYYKVICVWLHLPWSSSNCGCPSTEGCRLQNNLVASM